MRFLVVTALALSAAAFSGAAPANATWSCQGGDLACGASSAKAGPSHTRKAARSYRAPRAAHVSHRKAVRHANTRKGVRHASKASRSTQRVAYSGGGQSGMASYYWQRQRLASGGWFNPNAMTAAHKTLPFGTKVRVTHLGTGRTVMVTINDRGPYIRGRIIDLSSAAAGAIGMKGSGVARVAVNVVR